MVAYQQRKGEKDWAAEGGKITFVEFLFKRRKIEGFKARPGGKTL